MRENNEPCAICESALFPPHSQSVPLEMGRRPCGWPDNAPPRREDTEAALTPEEWKAEAASDGFAEVRKDGSFGVYIDLADDGHFVLGRPHAVAAVCLRGQPFGFTQEDVVALRYAADDVEGEFGKGWPGIKELRSIADRIEALLPPEEAKP